MRLINADKLLEYGACPNDCNGTTTCAEDCEHLHCPVRVFDIESINDAPTVKAIPLDRIKQSINEVSKLRLESGVKGNVINDGIYIDSMAVLNILDKLIAESEGK